MTGHRFGPAALIAAHPFLAAALVCHAMLLGGLSFIDSSRVAAAQHAEIIRETAESEERAQVARSRSLVKEIEAIDRAMSHGTAADAAGPKELGKAATKAELDRRAAELVERIEGKDRSAQAKKLAELLKIPVPDAEAKLKKETERQRAAHPDGENSPTDLQRRAEIALAHERQRDANGVGVGPPGSVGFGGGTVANKANPGSMWLEKGPYYPGQILNYDGDKRTYGALQAVDTLEQGSYKLGAGRSFGPGGVAADRVFVDSWYIIGPFQGRGAQSQNSPYPPEDEIDLDAAYMGKDGHLVRWQYVQFPSYPIIPPIRAENAVYYGFTEVDMDEERDVDVSMGADDDATFWLNGRVIWKSGGNDKPWYHKNFSDRGTRIAQMNLSEVKARVHFRKGHNALLFKLYNGPMNLFFSLIISR